MRSSDDHPHRLDAAPGRAAPLRDAEPPRSAIATDRARRPSGGESAPTSARRHSPAALTAFARSLPIAVGAPDDRVPAVAEILVEGDLLGHTTHGLQLLAAHFGEIERGAMRVEGEPTVLGGSGRADRPTGRSAAVFLEIFDPAAFGGLDAFRRETGWLAEAARAVPARPGGSSLRMPGEAALRRRRDQMRDGIALHPGILPGLTPWAERFAVALPGAVGAAD
ncbi:hypothetical protein EYW49_06200 [Siculibacillus lacustris]|uniref:Ldh family oxidoreductase n=1 Tax=Siculibacillus lacustris TaxID=1549641 RepID=A0A4Q9VW46_9HYPH|nr:Ldh family oxidoreductase [Siculibacillus lacustris]TBW39460.1 hypothetical protein EYW49_06200 [Siculibacillus lacustris]